MHVGPHRLLPLLHLRGWGLAVLRWCHVSVHWCHVSVHWRHVSVRDGTRGCCPCQCCAGNCGVVCQGNTGVSNCGRQCALASVCVLRHLEIQCCLRRTLHFRNDASSCAGGPSPRMQNVAHFLVCRRLTLLASLSLVRIFIWDRPSHVVLRASGGGRTRKPAHKCTLGKLFHRLVHRLPAVAGVPVGILVVALGAGGGGRG
mmetsp:Transcript_8147/g.15473  ORF Transcript_8147/g.15473 Transcript_8147/m.15473 type:complete len:201 (-) Transcript_8147:497-1099(-)